MLGRTGREYQILVTLIIADLTSTFTYGKECLAKAFLFLEAQTCWIPFLAAEILQNHHREYSPSQFGGLVWQLHSTGQKGLGLCNKNSTGD